MIGEHSAGTKGGILRVLNVCWDFDVRGKIPNAVTPTGYFLPKGAHYLEGRIYNQNPPVTASGNVEVGWLGTAPESLSPGSQVGVGVEVADRNGFMTLNADTQQVGFRRTPVGAATVNKERFASDVEVSVYASNSSGSTQSSGKIFFVFFYVLD